jgi:carbohydrate-selective porin OprB
VALALACSSVTHRPARGQLLGIMILATARLVRADEDSSADIDWLRHVQRLPPRQDHAHIAREQALAFINVNTRIHQEPLVGNVRPQADFSWWAPRPTAIPVGYVQADPILDDPLQPAVNPVRNAEEWMWLYAGTSFDLYDSMVMQALSDSLPGARGSEATNRFNIRMDTKLFEWEDRSHTQFTVQWRANNFMPSSAQPLAASVGSPTGLNAQRTIYDTKLNRLILAQGFLEDRLTISLGKINPNDYMGLNLFASDETGQFLNTALDGNNVLPVGFQGYTEGGAFQFLPVDWFYVNGVVSSASGTAGYYFDRAFQKGVFAGLETGVILPVMGQPLRLSGSWGSTNANVATIEGGPEVYGNSWTAIAQWLATDDLGVWAQFAAADASVAYTATNEGMFGITIDHAFGRAGDGFGLGGGWTKPTSDTIRTQGLVESYYRLQVTGSLTLSFDVQLLLPPGSDALSGAVVAGALRAKFAF